MYFYNFPAETSNLLLTTYINIRVFQKQKLAENYRILDYSDFPFNYCKRSFPRKIPQFLNQPTSGFVPSL